MRACEHAGDERTHAIMSRLNESFITPFDREDIYRLASNLDDVMDYMEAAADLIVLYQIDDLPKERRRQVEVLERAAELTAEAMPRLRSMKNLNEYWIEINRLENQADQVYRRLLAKLFSGEYDALTVLKMKEVVDSAREGRRRLRAGGQHGRVDRGQGILIGGSLARARHRVVVIALVFDYTNGFHDAANAIATSVSTRALTPRVALVDGRGR